MLTLSISSRATSTLAHGIIQAVNSLIGIQFNILNCINLYVLTDALMRRVPRVSHT